MTFCRRNFRTAVGKLGVVVTPDRPPRLAVDSSVSGVTSNTRLPNKAPNPSLSDVRKCMPLCPANESLAGLVLDVSKAHRRVRIRSQDQGLLCFRHRDVLYQSVTLNFGARASGFYWNRVAGLLVRLAHRLWRVRHSALIYVDDLLAVLLRSSAPLLSALLVILLCVLRVPMSWHKAALSARVTWIGWSSDFETFTVQLDPSKMQRLLILLRQLAASPRCSVTVLEKLTGKLLWLSNMFPAYSRSHHSMWTSTVRCPICAAFPLTSIRPSGPLSLLTSASLPPFHLQPFPWAASFSELHILPPRRSRTFLNTSPLVGSGCRFPTHSVRIGSYLTSLRKWFACGCLLHHPRTHFALSFFVRFLSAMLMRTPALTPPRQASVDLSACPTAARLASRKPYPPPSSATFFPGSLLTHHRNIVLRPGRCLHR